MPPPIPITPKSVPDLNVHVGIRGIMHARRRKARGSENCSDFGFFCRCRKYPVFMSTVCLYCSAEVPLDLSSLCSQRHKQVLTAADCFDIYLIRDATSQSDSSPEQQRRFRAMGETTNKVASHRELIDERQFDGESFWQLWPRLQFKDWIFKSFTLTRSRAIKMLCLMDTAVRTVVLESNCSRSYLPLLSSLCKTDSSESAFKSWIKKKKTSQNDY